MKRKISPELQTMIILCQLAQAFVHDEASVSPALVGFVKGRLWRQSLPEDRCELLRQQLLRDDARSSQIQRFKMKCLREEIVRELDSL